MIIVKETIYEGEAKHFAGVDSIEGKLYLTKESIVFIPQKLNIQNHALAMPVEEIRSYSLSNNHGIVPNGLTIYTKSGGMEKFAVKKRKVWIEKIRARCGH